MKVLLARPHDFVVAEMGAWITRLGLTAVRLQRLAELEAHPVREVAAVVVSTAVTSAVAATFGEALAAARKRFPSAPLVLAGLSSVQSARTGVAPELAAHGLSLRGISETASWGDRGTALYVQDEDFKPGRVELLTQVGRQHLRLL